ncbi:serine hydrolase domain-containing protein [Streptomyces sp.]|uniref:serine hydrolase domain-containing protein n=1 Tax=Streptomyces sp. TaxID=1931 RepID=UPI0028115B00|nr:serine hydrolase domain-containing protein [Streptomyces sp.]
MATKRSSYARLAAAVTVSAAVLAGALTSPAAASADGGAARMPLTRVELRRELERTLKEAGYVGASVEVRDGRRRIRASAGEAELGGGRPVARGERFRAASVTKAFTATVVLQLAAEGRLSLDDTVDRWLPGVVSGNGNDGGRITLRNLLQHTSGIHNYDWTEDTGTSAADFERTRFDHVGAEDTVARAMEHAPDFPPAAPDDPEPDWNYSNPNYILAGMVVQKVTGRSWAQEVRDRIIRPLGLRDTYEPGDDPRPLGPHAHTYQRFPGSTGWTDTTERNMSMANAAGSLISGHRDLDTFFTALFDGRLLPPEQLARMRRTVPASAEIRQAFPELEYGLGLMRQPLACGGHRWGHGGDLEGGTVRTGFTEDGQRSVVIVASGKTPGDEQLLRAERAVQRLTDLALCGRTTD